MQFLEQVPLAPYTTFQIGGPARWFAEAASEDDIAAGIAFAGERRLPLFILGGGSNLLVSDTGFSGLVLHIALRGIRSSQGNCGSIVSAAAGEDWDGLVAYAVAAGFAGVECLSGIPGTVGGTPVQNVGAYGQEVSQTIVTVRAFDRETRRFLDLPASSCGFSYRRSIFNSTQRERYVVSRWTTHCVRMRPPTSPTPTWSGILRPATWCRPHWPKFATQCVLSALRRHAPGAWRCGLPQRRQLLQKPRRPGSRP